MHTLHMDHVGPLATTSKNYRHLLVLVDAFTKYVWIFPTKSTGTEETLKNLRIIEQHFGNPQRIITDRGSAFTATEFKEHCEAEKIQLVHITTGVPRANGQVERANAIVETVFTKLAEEEPLKWYKYVSRVQRAINSTYQRSIKTTPYNLLFGIKMSMPDDLQLTQMVKDALRLEFQQERNELRELALKQIEKVQRENQRGYNRNHKEAIKYKKGDLVAIVRTQQGPGLKIKIKFLGPYKVTKVKGRDRYDVVKIDDVEGPESTSTSADHMKPWRGHYADLDDDELDNLTDSNDEERRVSNEDSQNGTD